MSGGAAGCALCADPGGNLIWQDDRCRVIAVDDADYPGYCRVIWNRHVREMSDLAPAEQQFLMTVVFAVESAVRGVTKADKINLASLGNVVPHLHWHIIPRWRDDACFPQSIWSQRQRECPARAIDRSALANLVRQTLAAGETVLRPQTI